MNIIAEFKKGCNEGWNTYWAPFTGLIQKARTILQTSVA